MIAVFLTFAFAAPIVEDVGRGLVVDWSTMQVSVEAGSYRAGAQATKAVEQSARLAIDDRLEAGIGVVRVAPGVEVQQVLDDPELGEPVRSRRSRWRVAEASYAVSGKVDLKAELSLQEFLKPWTLQRAIPRPSTPPEGAFSGVVIDARGLGAQPAFVVVLQGPDGSPIWSGELWDEDAVSTAPCVWVSDRADAAAVRAGTTPLNVAATSANGATLVLGPTEAASLRELQGTAALSRGNVVVLTDLL